MRQKMSLSSRRELLNRLVQRYRSSSLQEKGFWRTSFQAPGTIASTP